MDEAVDPAESITRYLRNSTHLRVSLGRPHFSAYMPRAPDGDLSVYRTSGMTLPDIAALGAKCVARPESPLKGHCNLGAFAYFSEGLDIASAPNPHERHANVRGWATDAKNRIIARKLADQAILTVY